MRELQSRGVQATREVQFSARKVVADNARLKALLRYVGVDDQAIETWAPDNVDQSFPALSERDKKAGKCTKKVSLLRISLQGTKPVGSCGGSEGIYSRINTYVQAYSLV